MALEQSSTWTESVEKSKQRDKLSTAVQFLLNCFGSLHHLEMIESICFVLKDVRTFLLGMKCSSRVEVFSGVPSTVMDTFGFLTLNTAAVLDLTIITKDELLLLFVVYHLSLNGKSHFEEVVKDLRNRAPPLISMILSCASVADKMGYLRKYHQYFRVDDSGHLELPNTFNLKFEYSSDGSGSSSEADESSEPKTEDLDSAEIESNSIIKNEYISDNSNKSSCLTQKEFISKRIRSSVLYLQQFFKLKLKKKSMRVILLVLKDVEIYFLNALCADKVDVIQNSFVSSVSKDLPPIVLSCSSSAEVVAFLNREEQEQLYFCYSIVFGRKMHCRILFDNFFGRSKCTSDSEKLSYLKKFNHLLSIDENHIVNLKRLSLPDLHLHSSFMFYIFKSYGGVTAISSDGKTNEALQSQDIWCKDNLIYKRLCSFVCFLLHSFGAQPCDYLKKCISFVFPDIGIFLGELSIKEQEEFFSYIPWTVLKSDNYLQLTLAYVFDTTYAIKSTFCDLYIVSSLALNGETHGMKVIGDFHKSVPHADFPNFARAEDRRWKRYLSISNLWNCDSSFYLTLPSSFYLATDNLDVLSQAASNKDDSLLISEFCVSREALEALGLPQDILDILVERMVACIAYLLKFFELNIHSRFLEVVLHFIKKSSAFFKLPSSHQKEVIIKCFRAFRIDEQGNVTYIHTKRIQTCTEGINRKLTICMSYIISNIGSMHYRKAFEYYRNIIGWTDCMHDAKQMAFFRNRKHYFLVCDSGYVSLANIPAVEFDYVSILMSKYLCSPNTIVEIKKEVGDCD